MSETTKTLMIIAREIVAEKRNGMLSASKAKKLWHNAKHNFGVLNLRHA